MPCAVAAAVRRRAPSGAAAGGRGVSSIGVRALQHMSSRRLDIFCTDAMTLSGPEALSGDGSQRPSLSDAVLLRWAGHSLQRWKPLAAGAKGCRGCLSVWRSWLSEGPQKSCGWWSSQTGGMVPWCTAQALGGHRLSEGSCLVERGPSCPLSSCAGCPPACNRVSTGIGDQEGRPIA